MPRNAQWTDKEDEELTKLVLSNKCSSALSHNGSLDKLDWDRIHHAATGTIERRTKNAMMSRWWKIKESRSGISGMTGIGTVTGNGNGHSHSPSAQRIDDRSHSNHRSNAHSNVHSNAHSNVQCVGTVNDGDDGNDHQNGNESNHRERVRERDDSDLKTLSPRHCSQSIDDRNGRSVRSVRSQRNGESERNEHSLSNRVRRDVDGQRSAHRQRALFMDTVDDDNGSKIRTSTLSLSQTDGLTLSMANGLGTSTGSGSAVTATSTEMDSAKKRKRRNWKKGKRSKCGDLRKMEMAMDSEIRSESKGNLKGKSNGNPIQNIIHHLLSQKEEDGDTAKHSAPSTTMDRNGRPHGQCTDKMQFEAEHGDDGDDGTNSSDSDHEDGDDDDDDDDDRNECNEPNRRNTTKSASTSTSTSRSGHRSFSASSPSRFGAERHSGDCRNGGDRNGNGGNGIDVVDGRECGNGKESDLSTEREGVGGRVGVEVPPISWYKKYYGHDLDTLRLVSFDLTQITPFIKAFEHQVVMAQSDSPSSSSSSSALRSNLRETILLQNKLLSELYTKIQHQQGIVRELVENDEKLKFKLQFVFEREAKTRAQNERFHGEMREMVQSQLTAKDEQIGALSAEMNTLRSAFEQGLSQNLQQFQGRYDELHSEYMAYRKQSELGNKEMATLCRSQQQQIEVLTAKYRQFTRDLVLSLSALRSLDLDRDHETVPNGNANGGEGTHSENDAVAMDEMDFAVWNEATDWKMDSERMESVNERSTQRIEEMVHFVVGLGRIMEMESSPRTRTGTAPSASASASGSALKPKSKSVQQSEGTNSGFLDGLKQKLYGILKETQYALHIDRVEKSQTERRSLWSSQRKLKRKRATKRKLELHSVSTATTTTDSKASRSEMATTTTATSSSSSSSASLLCSGSSSLMENGPRKKRKKMENVNKQLPLPLINGAANQQNVSLHVHPHSHSQPQPMTVQQHRAHRQQPQPPPPPPVFTSMVTPTATPHHPHHHGLGMDHHRHREQAPGAPPGTQSTSTSTSTSPSGVASHPHSHSQSQSHCPSDSRSRSRSGSRSRSHSHSHSNHQVARSHALSLSHSQHQHHHHLHPPAPQQPHIQQSHHWIAANPAFVDSQHSASSVPLETQFNIAATTTYHYPHPQTMLQPQNLLNRSAATTTRIQPILPPQMTPNKVLIPQILPPALSAHVPPPLPAINGTNGGVTESRNDRDNNGPPPLPPPPPLSSSKSSQSSSNQQNQKKKKKRKKDMRGIDLLLQVAMLDDDRNKK